MKDEIRDLKISIITNEINFRFDQNRVKELKNELRFIRKNFPDDIITGSLSLSLYGLLERSINDIDIVILDSSRYQNYDKSNRPYNDNSESISGNRLGTILFKFKKSFIPLHELSDKDPVMISSGKFLRINLNSFFNSLTLF